MPACSGEGSIWAGCWLNATQTNGVITETAKVQQAKIAISRSFFMVNELSTNNLQTR
ncbi:hypothetical protein [Pontibacter sp. G13]|uniref:hypothetical protein n=1 Tax=Pontibacter sp. G13 TaxID=3074898 RepID=UPI00288C2BBE|nr:hypothetical protein [Pontibacter sp. G13]WNJ19932.1 hypothetical protein RJD25_05565 [Pontibacter sp. G13]